MNVKTLALKSRSKYALELSLKLNAPVIPCVGKRATIKQWQNLTVTESRKPEHLQKFEKGKNIAILLGRNANGLCSIDVDSDEGLHEMLRLNPRLKGTLCSKGARGGNLWVSIKGKYHSTCKLVRGDDEPYGEFRSTGSYTVIDGEHPSGVRYQSNGLKPIEIRFDEIKFPKDVHFKKSSQNTTGLNQAKQRFTRGRDTAKGGVWSYDIVKDDVVKDYRGNRETLLYQLPIPELGIDVTLLDSTKSKRLRIGPESRRKHESRYRKYLDCHYAAFIARSFRGKPGTRNKCITDRVPHLFNAVSVRVIVPMLRLFYSKHRKRFNDSMETHTYQTEKMIELANKSFCQSLSAREWAIYRKLNELERAAFRIMRSFATLKDDHTKPERFFLSCAELRRRLFLRHDKYAQKIFTSFELAGIIKCVRKGHSYHRPGQLRPQERKLLIRYANEYVWALK